MKNIIVLSEEQVRQKPGKWKSLKVTAYLVVTNQAVSHITLCHTVTHLSSHMTLTTSTITLHLVTHTFKTPEVEILNWRHPYVYTCQILTLRQLSINLGT